MAEVLGNFEQAVLLAILYPTTELGEQRYGRAILKEVEIRLNRAISAGAVYATLDRLETKGLVSSELGPGDEVRGDKPRRYFRVERDGVMALNDAREALDKLWIGIPKKLRVMA